MRFSLLPVVLAALALGACAPDASTAGPPAERPETGPAPDSAMTPLYYLSLEVRGALVTASVNGLVVYRSDSPYGAAHSGPVNANLVGRDNHLTVRLDPSDPAAYAEAVAGGMDPLDGVFLEGALVRYPPSTDYVPSDPAAGDTLVVLDLSGAVAEARAERAGALAAEVEAAAAADRAAAVADPDGSQAASLAGALPITVEAEFDAEDAPSFRSTLLEGAVADDREAVLDYAERLRDLFAAADGEALIAEYTDRNAEYARAYPMDPLKDDEFAAYIAGELPDLRVDVYMAAPRSAIVAEPLNGGRQWELRVWRTPDGTPAPGGPSDEHPGARLTPFVAADEDYEMDVVVGLWDGELKVVR